MNVIQDNEMQISNTDRFKSSNALLFFGIQVLCFYTEWQGCRFLRFPDISKGRRVLELLDAA